MIARLLARHIGGYRLVSVRHEELAGMLIRDLHPRAVIASVQWLDRTRQVLADLPYDVPLIGCGLPHHTAGLPGRLLAYLTKPIPPEALEAVMRKTEGEQQTTVLIADDDPDAVRLVEMMLTALPRPYRILRAHDGLTALELLERHRPDVLLLDLVMPGLTGEELLQEMQKRPALSDTPVVILSAHEPADARVALSAPINLFFAGEVDLARAGRCLDALISTVNARYLPELT
jgi:CheY-like chemotaxis protein